LPSLNHHIGLVMHSRRSLLRQLQSLGVRRASVVMVHASLRRLGPVDGGADAVLDALRDAITSDGTLLMILAAEDDVPFDARCSPAWREMGVLAERFRQREDTRVNDHAAARFGAAGPRAEALLDGTPLHDYFGPGSVLSRFTDAGGDVLRLGADVDTITLTHWAEYVAELPAKRRVRRRYVRADVGEQWIEGLDDTDGIADWPHGDYFSRLWLDYLDTNAPSTGPVGACRAELFAAAPFVSFATRWLETHLAPVP
jgi:aminoglycoside N3'-acetyltransferase